MGRLYSTVTTVIVYFLDVFSRSLYWNNSYMEVVMMMICECATKTSFYSILVIFSIFFPSGKRGRIVPVILTPTMVRCFRLLYKCRSFVGVRTDNLYFFALPGCAAFTRGWDAMKRYVTQCRDRLQVPQSLTGTQLRKQVFFTDSFPITKAIIFSIYCFQNF